jgi:hypothetical protein
MRKREVRETMQAAQQITLKQYGHGRDRTTTSTTTLGGAEYYFGVKT